MTERKRAEAWVSRVVGYRVDDARCPVCGDALIVRKRRSDGHLFLGCNDYPECRFARGVRAGELDRFLEELGVTVGS